MFANLIRNLRQQISPLKYYWMEKILLNQWEIIKLQELEFIMGFRLEELKQLIREMLAENV